MKALSVRGARLMGAFSFKARLMGALSSKARA